MTWCQVGSCYDTLKKPEKALEAYEQALMHNALSIPALTAIASIAQARDDYTKATELFARVLALQEDSGDVWGALGHCYLMMDDLTKAYESYQQALFHMKDPRVHEPKLWYGIGILYDRYGSLDHVEEAFSSVIKLDPGFDKANEIYFRLGIIYKQQKKMKESLECFCWVLNSPPKPLTQTDIWFQIGQLYQHQDKLVDAREAYNKVLAQNLNHAKVLQHLGSLYATEIASFFDPERLIEILSNSINNDSNDPFTWYLLGRAFMAAHNYNKAYDAYQQTFYQEGRNPAYWCSIGVLYYNIKQ
ncbi:TPR-like protein [Atractiella rhizophila]|nr:TPR-like protein [Atractiella rhizophila]